MTNHILLEVGDDGVALVTLNVAGRAFNVFTPEFTSELQAVVDQLASRTDIVGAVITSGKPNGFMAGADLLDFVHVHDRGLAPREAAPLVAPAPAALRPPERFGKPAAAAIHGLAPGGGFQPCPACPYRVL